MKLLRLAVFIIGVAGICLSHAQAPQEEKSAELINKVPPPPKSIQDVIKLLDAAKPDATFVKKNQELVNATPPSSGSNEELWSFYKRRAKAADQLGMNKLMAQDCEKEIEYAPKNNYDRYHDAIFTCVNAEFRQGNVLGAIQRLKEGLKQIPSSQAYGWQLAYQMLLINGYRVMGDLESAQTSVREMEGLIFVLQRGRAWTEWGNHFTSQAERARGEYQLTAGLPVAAELSFVRSLRAQDAKLADIDAGRFAGSDRNTHDKTSNIFSRAIVLSYLSRSLLSQRKLAESEYYARLALKSFLSVGSRNSTAVSNAITLLAVVVQEQGRTDESLVLAKYAYQAMVEAGVTEDSTTMIGSRRALAAAYVSAGKYKEAVEQFDLVRKSIQASPELQASLKRINDLDEVVARLQSGQAPEAEKVARDMYQNYLKVDGANRPRTAWTQALMAASLQLQGKSEESRKAFDQAIPVLVEQTRNDSENQTVSIKSQKRFNIVIESYIETLFAEAKANPAQAKELVGKAFQMADLARGSSVQRALTQSTARANITDKRLAQLARKEQDLQRQINSLNELLVALSAASPEKQLPAVQAKMKINIDQLRVERTAVKKEIENKFPEYFDLVEPKPITVTRTAKILKPSEVLVTWYFGERNSYAWAIHTSGLDSYASLGVTQSDVATDVEKMRKSLDPGVASVEDIPPFDVVLANKFYNKLIQPVEGSLTGKQLLISIPHAALGQLPISTFITEPVKQPAKGAASFVGYRNAPWLVRKIAISQLPSVNALAALRNGEKREGNKQSFIAFADPFFSAAQANKAQAVAKSAQVLATRGLPLRLRSAPKTSNVSSAELALLPALPDTSVEVHEIGKVLGASEADLNLHDQASVQKVMQTDFSNKSIVMFSTHGLVPGELDGLTQPALALSSPEVTGEKDSDGLLTMDKILELKLNADWVVLSACNTASGDGSSEALSGLGRAFFYAGAKALLVSNWPVDTVASRQLMTDLFKRQAMTPNLAKPEALRLAMLELADKGQYAEGKGNSYVYAHPLFWAPFVVVGD